MSKTCVCAVSTGPSEAGPRMLAGHNLSLSVFEDGYSVPTGFLLHISGCRYSVRTLTIFLVMSTLLLGSRPADADGMYAPEDSGDDMSVSDIRSPDQHGLLIDRGEEQELVVRVRVTSTPRQLAWVLPLPSAPLTAPLELVEGDRLFEYLYHLSAPRWTEAEDVVSGAMPSCGDHGADGDIDSAEGVTLLGAKMIGELEVTTLEASSADELVVWLGSNGYRVPEDLAQVAQPYVDRKWVFVAMKLDSPIQPEGDVRLQRIADGQACYQEGKLKVGGDAYPLHNVRSLTTEGNNRLDIGLGSGQRLRLRFASGSPLKWQRFLGLQCGIAPWGG